MYRLATQTILQLEQVKHDASVCTEVDAVEEPPLAAEFVVMLSEDLLLN